MRNVARRIANFIYLLLDRKRTFNVLLVLFVLQATWLALTAIYPLPFDEYAHVGAIQLYAKQWSWIVTSQPIDSGIIGDLTREPSFLYRWLMSFPYRIMRHFFSFNQVIIAMRLLNVTMVAGGIVLYRKFLREINFSQRQINVIVLAFIMTPIVPFLAAHVNYDNMMFLFSPIVFIYAIRILKDNNNLISNMAKFWLAGLVAVLAKQTFLPIMAIISLYVVVAVVWRNKGNSLSLIKNSWQSIPKNVGFFVFIFTFAFIGLMALERYGINLSRYGTHSPKCETVQSVELCRQFGPWYRNKVINVNNRPSEPPYGNPLSFTQYWATRMMRGFFAIFQHTPTKAASSLEPFGPIETKSLLPLPICFAVFIASLGVVFAALNYRRIWHDKYIKFMFITVIGFTIVQWVYNYQSYLRMWKAEGIQARYTYPILFFIFAIFIWLVNSSLRSKQLKSILLLVMIVFYVWGGGIAGWLIRADESWRWQIPIVQSSNRHLQNFLRHTVIH